MLSQTRGIHLLFHPLKGKSHYEKLYNYIRDKCICPAE